MWKITQDVVSVLGQVKKGEGSKTGMKVKGLFLFIASLLSNYLLLR